MTGDKPLRHWTEGRPLLGLHVRGTGLSRNALSFFRWAALPWAGGLYLLWRFVEKPPGAPMESDQGVIPAGFMAVPMIFAFAVGIQAGVSAVTTYRSWGHPMITRYEPPGTGSG